MKNQGKGTRNDLIMQYPNEVIFVPQPAFSIL
jgi:hypothetical protein